MENNFEFIAHPADVQAHCWGRTLEDAYSQAALALMKTMVDLKEVKEKIEREFVVKAPDKEMLLVDYLSEFLAVFDIDGIIFSTINVEKIEYDSTVNEYTLHSTAYGEKFNQEIHEWDTEVKAITYSYLRILEQNDKVEIYVVFDI